jgi:aryl-alcohol dehydrogenase-like predicted oxidoreductase
MKRRDFLAKSVMGVAATWLGSKSWAGSLPPAAGRFSAADIVTLGQTGIKTSRLACGTGTIGYNHHSNQSALGIQGLADLLSQGYDHGLRFFDTADSYGTHPHVAAALKKLPREKITVMSKSWSRDAAGVRADIDRFRKELGTDYIDILMMHCLQDDDWMEKYRPAMDAISEAQEKGIIRAHGCSCHTIGALRAAAKSPWVQIMLSRVNPIGSHMDADPETVVATLRAGRESGKAIIGMKILGQGDMRSRQDEALKYALSLGLLDAFTIGAENRNEQLDLINRIAAAEA